MSETVNWSSIVLAAGKGTRMKSPLPKVLHPVAGQPMLSRIVKNLTQLGFAETRIVAGHGYPLVEAVMTNYRVTLHKQIEQKGTADAVQSAQPSDMSGHILIINGDHPLIEKEDILFFMSEFMSQKLDLAVVTCQLKNPKEFGRIVRYHGELKAIVEVKDASVETRKIKEINTGIYCVRAEVLNELLPKVTNFNANKEFYLTDIVSLALEAHFKVGTIAAKSRVAFGVNTQAELARASQYLFRKKAQALMESGVLILDPDSTYVEESVQIEPGCALYPNVFIRGNTKIDSFTSVEPHSFIVDSEIGKSVQIKAGTYLERVKIYNEASVGPYARLRPETIIGEKAHVGNFVEMKKVKFGKSSKAGHLTYLGDAEIGEEVNIGCGTITCNYAVDKKKYKTIIGNRVFVGSDSQFVAPIEIGDDAVIGSGSTITKNVPPRALAVARGRQVTKENWSQKKEEEPNK